MKKSLLPFLLIICCSTAFSQTGPSFTRLFDSLFANISMADATTGLLYDRVVPFANLPAFNSNRNPNVDTIDASIFLQGYFELYNAAIDPAERPLHTVNELRNMIPKDTNLINIGIVYYRYNTIDSSVAVQKLFFDEDSILREDKSIEASLFAEDTIFFASPLVGRVEKGIVYYKVAGSTVFNNTGDEIGKISIDFDDGRGFRNVHVDEMISVNYPDTGTHTLHFRIYLPNNRVYDAYSKIVCFQKTANEIPYPKDIIPIRAKIPFMDYEGDTSLCATGKICICYAHSDKLLRKPIIVSDGFDPQNARCFESGEEGKESLWKMLAYNNKHLGDTLISVYDYDIVFVDYDNGGEYIERNAMVFVAAIDTLNKMLKQNQSQEQIVVVGPSMGGPVTHYALSYIEKNPSAATNFGNHNCRLWIAFDSPQQGANINLGAQTFMYFFGSVGNNEQALYVWDSVINCPAAKQMLKYQLNIYAPVQPFQTCSLTITQYVPHPYFTHFYQTVDNLGYPINCRNLSIVNGSLNSTTLGSGCSEAIELDAALNIRVSKLQLFPTSGVCEVFYGMYTPGNIGYLIGNRNKFWLFAPSDNNFSIDVAPGGTFNTFQMIEDAAKTIKQIKQITMTRSSHCFMPITSTLDISGNINYGTNISSRDLVAEGLTPFDSYIGVMDSNMYHATLNQNMVDYLLNEIETYIVGQREIQLCTRPSYTMHLPQNTTATVTWHGSDNIQIVPTNNPNVVNVIPLYEGDAWICADVSTLGHHKNLAHYPIHISSNSSFTPTVSGTTIQGQSMLVNDTRYLTSDTFSIENGKTLTVTGTLYCADGTRIIVRPGGKLIVDGGTLTSACAGEMWQGIEVVGNRTQHQNAAHQGTVILRNNATIENAHCAIKTGLEGNEWLTSGGIVQCTGSTFKNNRRAVEFLSYADTLASGNIGDNKSWFKNCTFTLNDTNLFLSQGLEFLNHVTLWDVKGVSFEGCTFKNLTAGNTTDRKHAIYALGAGFKIRTLCDRSLDGCNCHGIADTNVFRGFSTAVEVGNDGCPYTVTIDEAKFENNGTGVFISACDYATVTRCAFDLSTSPIYPRGTTGLAIGTSTGYKVEGNAFTASANATSPSRTGIRVFKSGYRNNSIYRNTLNNLDYGIFVSDTNGSQRSGLCFTCNTFNDCDYGIYVDEDAIVSPTQGARAKGAANVFTGSQASSFYSLSPWQTTYYFKALQGHHLYQPLGLVLDSIKVGANLCSSTICGNVGPVWPVTGFGELVSSLLTPAGNSTAAAQNAPSLEEVSQAYYAAVCRIMADSVESLPDLLAWHAAAGALASPYALTEIFAAMDNSTGVSHTPQSQADAFSVGASHTPPISQPEMDNYAAFRALAASLRPSSNNPAVNWPAAMPAQIDELQRIAEAETGRSSAMAKGVLCFFFDICYGEEWESGTKAGVYSVKGTDVPQWTYWELALTEPVLYPKTFSLMEDTVLQGQSFRKSDFLMTDPGYHARNVMLKEDSTGMYYWDDILQETRVLYDYTAGEGDIYTVFPFMGDTLYQMKVTVDSVRVDQIDNQLLRVYYVTTASVSYQQPQLNWTFDINGNQHARIVEHIGATGFLLPMETALNDHFYSALCEYSDENIYYHPNDTVSCDEPYVYGLSQHDGSGIRVYPNPAHSSITVTCDRPMHGMVAYNRLGQPVYANANLHGRTEFTLDVSSWPTGLYLLQLTFPNGEQATRKVVKD